MGCGGEDPGPGRSRARAWASTGTFNGEPRRGELPSRVEQQRGRAAPGRSP